MAFHVSITEEADAQLRSLAAREQRIVEAAVAARLLDQLAMPTKAMKRLRPNPFAQFELRVRDLRVLYNVEEENCEVVLLIVGRKVGNKLIVGGEEFHEHRSDPPESAPDSDSGAPDEVL